MDNILKEVSKFGVVPVIKIEKIENALPLASALYNAGLRVAELTFRTDCAEEAIRVISEKYPDMLVGAGTVLNIETVDKAVKAGSKFIVSPGFNIDVVKYCIDKNIPIIPGCPTTSDIEKAIELGLTTVKFFPAEQLGGLNMIKALAAPYTKIKFMPTGGVNQNNINDYLSFPKIVACGGSWMVKDDLINNGDFDKIGELVEEAINTVLGFELAHVGINAENEAESKSSANLFETLFGKKSREANSSFFAGTEVEIMKTPYLGKNGHIAFRTNSIERALHYLSFKGVNMKPDTEKYDDKGNLTAVYLDLEISGFAIHLTQKK